MGRPATGVDPAPSFAAHLRRFLGTHKAFALLLLAGAAVRAVVTFGFRPILWFLGDSVSYLDPTVGGPLFPWRPQGYSLFLYALKLLHHLVAVAIAQHLLGLGIGIIVYAVCSRLGLPRWLSVLAAAPTLLDAWEITTEQMLLSETIFIIVVMAGLALIVWPSDAGSSRYWMVVLAGLLIGFSADLRSSGIFLIIPLLVGLLMRRVGWRRVCAGTAAFVVPLVAYAAWFDHSFGWFGLTPGGIYAYGRVVTFVDCKHVSLSGPERMLCPTEAEKRRGISFLIWGPESPYQRLPGSVHYKETLAEHFAVQVILQQPGDYVSTVFKELRTEFSPVRNIRVPDSWQYNVRAHYDPLPSDAMTYANLYQHGGDGQPHPTAWVARAFRDYQLWVHVPGLAFLIGAVVSLAALVAGRFTAAARRADLACFTLASLLLLILPVLVANFDFRYLVPVLPLLSVSTALAVGAFSRRRRPAPTEGFNLRDPGDRTIASALADSGL